MPDTGQHAAPAPSAGRMAGWGFAAGVAWLSGVGWQLIQPDLPSAQTLWWALGGAAGLVAAAAGLHGLRGRRQLGGPWRIALAAWLPAVALAGWALTGLLADARLAQRLPAGLEGRDLVVTGMVTELPQTGPNGLRLRIQPEQAHLLTDPTVPIALPPLLAIGWYTGWHEDAGLSLPQASLRAGQRWTFTLRLRRPQGNLNPHGYDYELQLFEQGIGATGYVRDGPVRPTLVAAQAGYPIERWRQAVRDAIFERVADRRAAGVLAALAIGDQSAIEREDWALFRQTGIAHLVSISGLHVTMFAWLAGALVGWVWRRMPGAALRLATPHAARWGGFIAATAYAVFAGWGVPAQRTVGMLGLVAGLASAGLRWPWPGVLVVAAVGVTLLDPWALMQPGFWLSFVAVGLLMASDPSQRSSAVPEAMGIPWRRAAGRALEGLRQGLRTQWVATIGLAPLGLLFFQQLSVVGLVANLVSIPLVTLLVTPLALLGIVLPPLWLLAAALVQALSAGLSWLAAWPFAVWNVPVAPVWAQLLGGLAAVIAVLPWPWRLRLLALPLALPLLLPQRELPPEGRFELIALDVGQGSAVLLRTRRHLLLFDAGPQYARDSDAGQRIVLPLLRSLGERRIDRLVLSHRDQDHVGGARSLLTGLPVGELLGSLEPEHPLHVLGVPNRRCQAGERWTWDGVDFEMLAPPASDYGRALKPNAMSCVLRVSGRAPASGAVLMTGDIEREQELGLLASHAAVLPSDVLIVPHHGSRTSSTAAFLEAVSPRIAVIQAGYRNRFGHPAPDVMARYRSQGIRTLETTACGAWRWQGDAALLQRSCERERARRHWHGRAEPAVDAAAPRHKP